jgi:hypothetical protein
LSYPTGTTTPGMIDPISSLPIEGQKLWEDKSLHEDLVQNAINASGFSNLTLAV